MNTIAIARIAAFGLVAMLTACGQKSSSESHRSITPAEEQAAGTPALQVEEYDSPEGFALKQSSASTSNQAIADLYKQASAIIAAAYATTNNVYISSIAYSVNDGVSKTQCVYVQIQQRTAGKRVALETLVPAGQADPCVPSQKKGLGLGTIGFLAKVAGNNYIGGLGVGAVYYDGTSLAGCAAGAVGYASETYNAADGTYGAWCSEVINVTAL